MGTSLNFEPSFFEIHQMLIETGYLNISFKIEMLANFEFLQVSNLPANCLQISIFHSHFHLKSKRKYKTSYTY